MHIELSPTAPDGAAITAALKEVRDHTWGDWRAEFEHDGPVSTNPIIASPTRFRLFCHAWRVGRTIKKGTREQFRLELLHSDGFSLAILDDTGEALDHFEREVAFRYGAADGKNSMRSVVSKLATFVRPERFVAWDQYARRGLNLALEQVKSKPFERYVDYLAAFDRVWNGIDGDRVRSFIIQNAKESIETDIRFQRRVLDLYLMELGGRGFGKLAAGSE